MTYLDVINKAKALRAVAAVVFALMLFALLVSMAHSITYQPKVREVLFNMQGSVYAPEDLGFTSQTEGQVKQALYETISKTFVYNYLDFVSDENYQKLLSGTVETDLPDHRDVIRPLYEKDAYTKLVAQLLDAPWMNRFHQQRRKTTISFVAPPMQETGSGFVKDLSGRLNISYVGSFVLNSYAKGQKPVVYQISYRATMERKAMIVEDVASAYYFSPMVPRNTFDWRVKDFSWDVERRR